MTDEAVYLWTAVYGVTVRNFYCCSSWSSIKKYNSMTMDEKSNDILHFCRESRDKARYPEDSRFCETDSFASMPVLVPAEYIELCVSLVGLFLTVAAPHYVLQNLIECALYLTLCFWLRIYSEV